jgi:hypothetical protein
MANRGDIVQVRPEVPADQGYSVHRSRDQHRSCIATTIARIQNLIGRIQMSAIELLFAGHSWPVPRTSVLELLRHHNLLDAKSYAVQSSVPAGLFGQFVDSLKTHKKIPVTKGNTASLSLLATEFFLRELAVECASFTVGGDPTPNLEDRVSQLERLFSSLSNPAPRLEEKIDSQARDLESLQLQFVNHEKALNGKVPVSRVDKLQRAFEVLRDQVKAVHNHNDQLKLDMDSVALSLHSETGKIAESVSAVENLRPEFERLQLAVQGLQQDVKRMSSRHNDLRRVQSGPISVGTSPSPSKREILITKAASLDGIVSYLTRKHGGNVQEKGIVTITSKSVSDSAEFALKNVADLTSDSCFCSNRRTYVPGQWVCWDFHEMRVSPIHYTIRSAYLKSWVLEGSLDGNSWTELSRQTDNDKFREGWKTASFAAPDAPESRFIRLTQTDKNYISARNTPALLLLRAVEFFGTLCE